MKKISFFFTAFFIGTALLAQGPAKFGLKAGVNISSLNIEDFDENDTRIGLHIGGLAHIHLGAAEQWALQPELVYSQEGGKIKTSLGTTKVKLDYINIPVMFQYMFNNGFRIEAGPQLGLLVNSKYDADGDEEDADDDFKSTNVSLGFGLSYLSDSGFGIGGRYNLGVSDIGEGSNEVKARTLQIGLFYLLDHSHKVRSR
ncbi:MAG: PorT family protein [Bacteroidota bacterium]|nr:PorT family protein [Bacteroidota bacterium]